MAAEASAPPIIVERERELAEIDRALRQGSEGTPVVALLVGEPGLGKSHLLRALPGAEESLVLRGYSLEADAPPYFPFRRALARVQRERAAPLDATAMAILAGAGVLPASNSPTPPPGGDHLAVLDALTELFIGLAAEQPVVLVLDDMQWAPAATWEAITYLVRAAEGVRLTIVLASRPEGIEPPSPGASAVSELNRNRLLRLLRLHPLSEDGIRQVVLRFVGSQPAPSFLSALASRTAGNPFFLEEVLRSITEAGRLIPGADGLEMSGAAGAPFPIPETLRLAIWQRLTRLPEASVATLQAAATLGRMFELPLLAAMLEQPVDWVGARLQPAVRAGIVDDQGGRWAFAHDTLRDAIFDQAGERKKELHRRAAMALGAVESAGSELESAAAIAGHLRGAEDSAAAITAALRASSIALAAHADQEALHLALSAEELFLRGGARPAHIGRRDICRAVAQAAAAAADYGRAESAWISVLELTDDPAEQARVLVALATVTRKAEKSDAAAGYFERALDLLAGGSDTRTLIDALVELSTLEGTTHSDYGTAVEHAGRALTLARETGDAAMEARAALALANAQARSETPSAARELLALAFDRAMAANQLPVAAEAAASLSNAYYWTGEVGIALIHAERRLEIAQRGRDAFALRHAHTWLGLLATTTGDWDRARLMIRQAEPAIIRLGSPEPMGFLRLVEGLLALRTGEIDLSLARTEEAMRIFTPLGEATVSWYVAVRIWALIAAGRTREAADECAAQELRLATMPVNALPARSSRCGLGRAYVALGNIEAATECEAKLAEFADDFHWRPARLTLAATAAIRGDRARSLALLSQVSAFSQQNGLGFDHADAERVAALLRGGATAQSAFARPDAPDVAVLAIAPAPAGLSPREVEVLGLVARGLSNREIAELLVLSERTVVNHVSHIFEKIGVENRAGATAWAYRSGLAASE